MYKLAMLGIPTTLAMLMIEPAMLFSFIRLAAVCVTKKIKL
jgi:hypothetical protein